MCRLAVADSTESTLMIVPSLNEESPRMVFIGLATTGTLAVLGVGAFKAGFDISRDSEQSSENVTGGCCCVSGH